MAEIQYQTILKRSLGIAWRVRWLWIYAAIIGAASAYGSSGLRFPSSSSSTASQSGSQLSVPNTDVSRIFGETSVAFIHWITNVPFTTWVTLGIIVGISLIFSGLVVWVVGLWARGGLITGVKRAVDGESVSLANTSPNGIHSIPRLFLLQIVYGAVIFLGFLSVGVLILIGFGISLISNIGLIIGLLIMVPVTIVGCLFLILFIPMVNIFAERLVVLRSVGSFTAFRQSIPLVRKHIIPIFIQGIIHQGAGCAQGCVTIAVTGVLLGPIGIVLMISAFSGGLHMPPTPLLVIAAFCLFLDAEFTVLINAITTVTKYADWQQIFDSCTEEELS